MPYSLSSLGVRVATRTAADDEQLERPQAATQTI